MLQILVVVAIVLGLVLAYEFGFRYGRRLARRAAEARKVGGEEETKASQFGTLQGAMLSFLAFLLGFSFAAAASRFMERQELIAREANAIGTAFLRADLLDEPYRRQLKEGLEHYTKHRIEVMQRDQRGVDLAAEIAKVGEFHASMWTAARDGSLAKPAVMNMVVSITNEVIDLHDERIAASRKHLPTFLLTLLFVSSLLSLGVLGIGAGMQGVRTLPISMALLFLVASTLWATLDLDHPRLGLIRLSDLPLQELSFGR